MRVISGSLKGKKLAENKFDHIRPTTDKVKQALFTKLQFDIEGARVLDVFCGTGALGIEALSRGAAEVIFVDKNPKSIALTKSNLRALGLNAKTLTADATKILKSFEGEFNLIILDPPYKSGLYSRVLEIIAEKKLLAGDGMIVCEHAKDEKIDFSPFKLIDQKRYGRIMLSYLQ